ncbi:MAG: hypothetical protein JXB39_16985 [Deltaproteobacteria bacterium]|nr:hypothetical protein [Deltaproteobacteria bacterium]
MRPNWILLAAGLAPACLPHGHPRVGPEVVEVRYRWSPPTTGSGARLLEVLPGSHWDQGLLAAARELAAGFDTPGSRISPRALAAATARAGFPGDARFAVIENEGAFPDPLVRSAKEAFGAKAALDVGLASRVSSDGTTLWILGFSPHYGEIDPMPRDLGLDAVLPVCVDVPGAADLSLVVASPEGPVRSFPFANRVTRQVDAFHVPGGHRLEVVEAVPGGARVDFVFEVFVEVGPPPPEPLPGPARTPDPTKATEALYRALEERRSTARLPSLVRFPAFEPLAREHSALMAAAGIVDHALPSLTEGVAARARAAFHPGARHHEDLAAAFSAEDAADLVWLSPGHRANLLCEPCTHVAIGTALEPSTDAPPRLFVTWEILEFPEGPPRPVARPR